MIGRIRVPASMRNGEAFEVRVLMQHPMETGFRRELDGSVVPMNIIDKVVCRYAGREVFSAEFGSGMSANPYVAFFALATQSGDLVVEWSDDRGEKGSVTAKVNVA